MPAYQTTYRTATFAEARREAELDMEFELQVGGSLMYVHGRGTAHNVNAVITTGNRVHRGDNIDTAAVVAAHHRKGVTTIAKLADNVFEVWA